VDSPLGAFVGWPKGAAADRRAMLSVMALTTSIAIRAVSFGHPTRAGAAGASVPAGFMSERPISIGFGGS
jgi:hypothetical protein